MSLSYLQSSIDRLEDAKRDDVIEICINPDGSCWGEFQGDHFMSRLDQTLTEDQVKDLGNQIASDAGTPLSKDKPIVSVSITYRDRPIRAQVITPPAVSRGMSISLRFFSSLPLDSIELGFLYGKERKLEELRQDKNRQLREVVASGDIDAAIRHCVENKLNMIVSGGTSTGKTVAATPNNQSHANFHHPKNNPSPQTPSFSADNLPVIPPDQFYHQAEGKASLQKQARPTKPLSPLSSSTAKSSLRPMFQRQNPTMPT